MCHKPKKDTKTFKKLMYFYIAEQLVIKYSQCYKWAEELPDLKTGTPKECLVYTVRKSSKIIGSQLQ